MFDLPPHDRYRSVPSPWLTQIPAHWQTVRTKSVLRERSIKGYPDEPLLAATQSHGVIRKSDYGNRTVTATKDLHLLKLVEVGDFVISLRSFQGGIERCHRRGIISPAYTVLTADSEMYRDFLTYLFKSKPFVSLLTLAVTGIREGQNIDYSKLAVELLPVPPVDEQAAIVRYLTHANARIDKAIAAKLRLIDLLDEQQQSMVAAVITRLEAPLVPIKRALQSVTAGTWGESPEESTHPARWCVRVADFDYSRGRVRTDASTVRAVPDRDFIRRSLRAGDLLLEGSGGGDKTPVGRVVLFDHQEPAVCSNFLQRMRVGPDVDPEYLCHVLRSLHATGTIRPYIKQTTGIQNLDLDQYFAVKVPLPELAEQRVVVALIATAAVQIEALRGRAQREIELLREFRTRLVADVVTGQVDVRGVANVAPGTGAQCCPADQTKRPDELDIDDMVEIERGLSDAAE